MKVTIGAPVDVHVHFRDHQTGLLEKVVPYHDRHFEYALVMPNTTRPVTSEQEALAYRQDILQYCTRMKPLMTVKLLPFQVPQVGDDTFAAKLYPTVTTNSQDGFSRADLLFVEKSLFPALEVLQEQKIPLCVHAEMPGEYCLHAETVFMDVVLSKIVRNFPALRIVVEHVTSLGGIHFVQSCQSVAATITLHHLLITLDDVVRSKLRPHNFCMPIAKSPWDRDALRRVVLDGNARFFLGSDSAPHYAHQKEAYECCAGCFTAPALLEQLAQFFAEHNALNRMNDFCSTFARQWYVLPGPTYKVALEDGVPWTVRKEHSNLIPFALGQELNWRVVDDNAE